MNIKTENNLTSRIFIIGLLGLSIYASFLVFQSFIGEILIATILVTAFYKPYLKIVNLLKGRRMLASFLICLLIVLVVIIPLASLVGYSAQRSVEAYGQTEQFFNQGNFNLVADKIASNPVLNKVISITGSDIDVKTYLFKKIGVAKDWLLSGAGNEIIFTNSKNILASTVSILFSIMVVMFCMFFFFIDGEKMLDKLRQWTPLSSKYDKAIFNKFKNVSNSVIFSIFATAIAQGIIGAIGFLIIGFPVFFASMIMAFATIIPYVGTALVWAPIGIYLLLTGQIWQGIFIMIWGAVVVGNSDNLIKTYIVKDKAGVHPLFIFFSIIGGLSLFGFWGLVYGPLIISLAVTVLHIYEQEFSDVLETN